MENNKEFFVDQEVLSGFVDEAIDDLFSVTQKLMILGETGFDENIIQSVFRVFHSIKGNAAYFSLFQIKNLSHIIEQVLDRIRKKEMAISAQAIELLIEGTGAIASCFDAIKVQGSNAGMADLTETTEKIESFLSSRKLTDYCPQYLDSILDDLKSLSTGSVNVFTLIEKYSNLKNAFQEAKEKTINSQNDHSEIPEEYARILELVNSEETDQLSTEVIDLISKLLNRLKESIENPEVVSATNEIIGNFEVVRNAIGPDPLIRELLREGLKKLPFATTKNAVIMERKTAVDSESSVPVSRPTVKTMRVSEHAVDRFLAFVGELVVVEDMYTNLIAEINSKTLTTDQLYMSMKQTTGTFSALSRELQNSIMEIRKVPVGQLFNRMPKVAHDVAQKKAKKIAVKIVHDDIRVDKTIIEKLEAPLVHMVRNAADHGIESPEVRLEQGKNEEGTITLDVIEIGEQIVIVIEDDGAGINLHKIRKKAVDLGIIAENSVFDEKRIIEAMFYSGVSTAETVTDVSGRGVGMDVVKRNLDEIGGVISTSTVVGKGTRFTLTIPSAVTTQIINGFIVRTESERFIIPLEFVEASMSIKSLDAQSVSNKTHMINFKGSIIEINRLQTVVDKEGSGYFVQEYDIVVVLQYNNNRKAFVVSSVDGIRQVVLKTVNFPGEFSNFISGGAVMGDGSVSLILNVEKLFSEFE